MRLCRFTMGESPLLGFYVDDHIIPLDVAYEAYCQANENDSVLPSVERLLDLLPPDGLAFETARDLIEWVQGPEAPPIDELAVPSDDVSLLVPIPDPPKLLLLAGNYVSHITEGGGVAVEREETFPYVFMKPSSTTLTNPGDPIIIPACSPDQIDWECELGVVIGRRCRHVTEAEALKYVAGYTVINDISDRNFTPNPNRMPRDRDPFFDWMHGKWHDTFCPIGPCILTADAVADPQRFRLRLTVNDELKQAGLASHMIFPITAIITFLSRFVTLEPGDIIATGTPSGVGASTGQFLRPGDVVEASIEGIGTLSNPVIAED